MGPHHLPYGCVGRTSLPKSLRTPPARARPPAAGDPDAQILSLSIKLPLGKRAGKESEHAGGSVAVCYANRGGLRSGDVSERSEEQGVHRPSPFVMLKVQHRKYIQAAAQWSVKYKRFLREPWVMRCSPDNARPPPALCKMGKLLRGEWARRGSRQWQLPPASPRGGMSPPMLPMGSPGCGTSGSPVGNPAL